MNIKDKAEKLFKKTKVFILSTIDDDGYPLTKAVSPGKFRDSLNEIYFCTNTSSIFATQIAKNSKTSIYFIVENSYGKDAY